VGMAEGYQKFLAFDWSDERWQTYLSGLYPQPSNEKLLKFKKKWYKKNIDHNFDDTYEPATYTSSASTSSPGNSGGSGKSTSPMSPFPGGPYADGSRWASMGSKATICFVAYAAALTMAVGAVAGAFPPYQSLIVLVSAFVLEILAKYGLKFNTQYVQAVLLDDVGVMPIMALTLLTPGLHPAVRTFALAPPVLTALLTFSQICKAHTRLPPSVRDFFSPLAETSARYRIMQIRAHLEVALGFVLVVAVFMVKAAPISGLFFWNFMMMRYMMSPWTQSSFRAIDNAISPVATKIPVVRNGYAALKRSLYGFVDPESKRAGRLCSIL